MGKTDVHSLTRIALFAAITSVLAFVSVPLPFSPVPVTAQSLAAMLAGLLLGPREGALSQLLYVLLGAAGMPIFAGNTSGIGVLAGPTGGYLWGFAAGAYVIGSMVQKRANVKPPGTGFSVFACVVGGVVVVYLFGILQLSLTTRLPLGKAIVAGALPFIPGDLLKACIAGLAGPRLYAALRASYARRATE
ncbi:MAG: biotin transporter BioY [Bacteroidota bacterium]